MGSGAVQDSLTRAEVLRRYRHGPQTGIFTDGGARPNPGPGGWGVVHVVDGVIQAERYGSERDTTNNRMELTALIQGMKLIDPETEMEVYSDSDLCVKTINEWAASWERRGWKRKDGPVKNLDLVRELYELKKERPKVRLKWIKAHNGWLWNEYVDSLASAWTRSEV